MDQLVMRPELQKMLGGVSSETMRVWIRDGKLPPPDVKITQRTTGWRRSTLRAAGIVEDPTSQTTLAVSGA